MAAMLRTFVLRDEPNARALGKVLKDNWRAMAGAGKPLAVTIQEHKARRSVDQNKRHWAILNEVADNGWVSGRKFSAEAWHEFFKANFIGYEETPDGRQIGISTTTLSVAEFGDYMTHIAVYAAEELGIEII